MKVVIPVAGAGMNLRPHTHTQPKPLVPVAGKPILGHIIDALIAEGIKDFVFVIGYLGNKIQEYVQLTYEEEIQSAFIVQQPRYGSAHSLLVAKELIKNEEELLVVLGDTIVELDYQELIRTPYTTVGTKKVDNPRDFGIAELNREGFIKQLVEKPRIPKSNLALVGIYKIVNVNAFLECIEKAFANKDTENGEYQLTDVLMRKIEVGERVAIQEVTKWYDCGKKETLLAANEILLANPKLHTSPGDNFPGNIILPPVRVGENCKITNSIIGPNVTLGDNTCISHSIIQNSIIGSYSELRNAVLRNSIIGNNSVMEGFRHSLNIGDNTEINFTK